MTDEKRIYFFILLQLFTGHIKSHDHTYHQRGSGHSILLWAREKSGERMGRCLSGLPSAPFMKLRGEMWWLILTVHLMRSRTTWEMGSCEDYLHRVNIIGKTCPLWVASFPRLGSWTWIKREKWAMHKHPLFLFPDYEHDVTSCLKLLLPCGPTTMDCILKMSQNKLVLH